MERERERRENGKGMEVGGMKKGEGGGKRAKRENKRKRQD